MKKKLIDRYLELDKHFIENVLSKSLSFEEFWKKLNVGAPLRTNRNGNEQKQFENHFGIQIRKTINSNIKNKKDQLFQIEQKKDRICKNPKCKKHFTWEQHANSDFCSKSCAASYSAQHVDPENIKKGLINNFKEILCAGGCGKKLIVQCCTIKKYCDECFEKLRYSNSRYCPICGKILSGRYHGKTCSKEHGYLLNAINNHKTQLIRHSSGGKRSHSGRGKKGRYHGIWCDSSWELAWVIYQEEHQIKFKKYHGYFEYEFEGKMHKYYPDFELEDGTIVEIKGYWSKQWQAKLNQFPKDKRLLILGKNEMDQILKYVKTKYGDDFIQMYE